MDRIQAAQLFQRRKAFNSIAFHLKKPRSLNLSPQNHYLGTSFNSVIRVTQHLKSKNQQNEPISPRKTLAAIFADFWNSIFAANYNDVQHFL
jgi:hypothetical protein